MKLSYLNSALACYSSVRWCMSVLDRTWEERDKDTKRLHLSLTKANSRTGLWYTVVLSLFFYKKLRLRNLHGMKLSYLNSALACYSSVRWCMSVLDRSWGERVKHTKRLHLSLTKAIYHPILAEIACLALYFQLRPTVYWIVYRMYSLCCLIKT